MGILLALIPAIGWGIQPLIARKVGGTPANQIVGTGLGALLIGLIVWLIKGSVSGTAFWLSFGAGFLWSLGQVGQYISFTHLGVTRTMPISTGLQIIGTSLIGVLAFGEWPGNTAKLIGAVAILLVIIGVALTAITDHKGQGATSIGYGLSILVPTTIGYWAYGALPKMIHAAGIQLFFPEMLGIFVGSLIYALVRTKGAALGQKETWQNGFIGIVFGISSLAYIFAAQSAGVATAFVITQLNVVVSTLGAMLLLHEGKSHRELRYTLVGLGLIVIGSMMTATL
ncbi:sugar transporter [Lactiplantibacillus pentosus]|jgi:glucose uptake protein|uniref:Glucose uptake protein n=1 Tax=Lactiplantibacillus pentosus IG1 TaxID=1042160 RepID=G0M5I3_LACPE|nr:GRP family sugar transporter [Lactiplantibacillus pentosus]CCC17514.1 glucose uptake protein [Lactiplantibacillus pentosus IG1]MCT3282653.1 sugar transporter [Lactiplantibacillus pentosus]MCT3302125.1 sugar transporter [Lactiplantibacillus pentosus]PRO76131.1 sugar transporter [Lactiplantibacillus pentosus]PRO77426.1 sugar transporter [Lactiplantibacillus pentosus]